jgi:hypothetical protein
LSSMYLFKNGLMFNLICEFSNDFLHESPIHHNILVHKSWMLHQIFKFFFQIFKFDIYSISIYFLKLYKEDATITPIASYRAFVIVNKAPCPQSHKKSFKWYTKSTFFAFSLFYLYFYICISFFYNFDEDRFSMVLINI